MINSRNLVNLSNGISERVNVFWMLVEEFLNPMKITQRELATAIHVPYQRVNELVNQKRGITPSTALRLASVVFRRRARP